MAFIQVVLTGMHDSEECKNVFYYNSDGETFDAVLLGEEFATAFKSAILDPLRTIQHPLYINVALRIEDVLSGTFYEEAFNLPGTASAGAGIEPSFTAYGIQLVRTNNATRSGYKRFAGVPKNAVDGSNPQIANNATDIVNVTDGLSEVLFDAQFTPGEYTPVIVRKDPETGAISAFNVVRLARFIRFTTQGSRKPD